MYQTRVVPRTSRTWVLFSEDDTKNGREGYLDVSSLNREVGGGLIQKKRINILSWVKFVRFTISQNLFYMEPSALIKGSAAYSSLLVSESIPLMARGECLKPRHTPAANPPPPPKRPPASTKDNSNAEQN